MSDSYIISKGGAMALPTPSQLPSLPLATPVPSSLPSSLTSSLPSLPLATPVPSSLATSLPNLPAGLAPSNPSNELSPVANFFQVLGSGALTTVSTIVSTIVRIFSFIIFSVMPFLLIFLPIAILLTLFGLFIYFLCTLWGYGKVFLDIVIQILNPIIPVPLMIWNMIAEIANIVIGMFGIGSPLPKASDPNKYKFKHGAPTMPQLFMWILYPLQGIATSAVSGYLDEPW